VGDDEFFLGASVRDQNIRIGSVTRRFSVMLITGVASNPVLGGPPSSGSVCSSLTRYHRLCHTHET
jgi:hypothetical protein